MNTNRRQAVVALCAAGLLWGTTVPLSKLALEWLPAGWLTAARFGLAAALLLPFTRRGLRAAFTPRVLIYGAIGYGGTVIVQNAGITRTSVTHAALMIGAVPVLIAVISAVWLRAVARPVAWVGFAISLGGVALVTGGGGGGATPRGDALVLASLLLSATFTVAQGRLLTGRDPIAVTAVEFLGAALGALAFSVFTECPSISNCVRISSSPYFSCRLSDKRRRSSSIGLPSAENKSFLLNSPCVTALRRLYPLPLAVRGPVDFWAFWRFARSRASDMLGLCWLVSEPSLLF